jgi:hypothetical protein
MECSRVVDHDDLDVVGGQQEAGRLPNAMGELASIGTPHPAGVEIEELGQP